MTDITTPWGCATSLFAVIRDAMPQFTDLVDMAMDVIADGDWFDDGPFYDGRLEEVKNMVRAVVGPVGLHMARWRSFEFSPPADYEWAFPGEAIWELFTHPTPNLEVFVLNGPISSEITPFSDVFPDLKSVRHLTLCDPDPDGFREASLSRHLLRTAVLHYDSENTLEVLSSCNALQELTITNIRRDSTDPVGRQDVELHSLRRLTLEGDMSALEHVVFHAPSLEDVTLRCEQVQGLPKVRARSCVWVPGGEKISDLMTSSVRGLLVGVEELEELIIECEPVEGLGVAVREMIEQQGSSVMETLRVIRFVKSGMEVDIIHIK
ncbi:hypothetical protein FRC17_003234 [Serendipita sp. 399]|nr:hypothetical protein FRC17_003234 [Serendipita sp. 399]